MTSGQIVQIFGDVNDSNIGVAGGDVRPQHVGIDESTKEELNDYLILVAELLDSAQLDNQLRAVVEANAHTLQSQMASPAPDRGILRRSVEVCNGLRKMQQGALAPTHCSWRERSSWSTSPRPFIITRSRRHGRLSCPGPPRHPAQPPEPRSCGCGRHRGVPRSPIVSRARRPSQAPFPSAGVRV